MLPRYRPGSHIVRQRGAALLLLLLALSLSGAGLLMATFQPSQQQLQRERLTGLGLRQAEEALLGFAVTHGRLPRPAVSATNGIERAEPCTSASDCSGFLPWVSLGLERADSWNKLLRYSVTTQFTVRPLRPAIAAGDKAILGRNSQGRPYFLVGAAGCSIRVQCAPAVIFSNGKHNLGTSADGLPQANATQTNVDEQQNDVTTNIFFRRATTADPAMAGGEFDDDLVWLPLQTLYRRMSAAGVLN